MMKKSILNSQNLSSPIGGAISTIILTNDLEFPAYAGTNVGIFCCHTDGRWERINNSPIAILCLVASPDFINDRTLIAGTPMGIFYSTDAGNTWNAANLPITSSTILCLAFSPHDKEDGILLAGTLEDGVLCSVNRGKNWGSRNFGLLDQTIFCIGFSPEFSKDGIAFLGAQGNLYYSYNHALAWKELPFPEDALPILSLGISPSFRSNQTLYAGTEISGLYRSNNCGQEWQKLEIPAKSVNGIHFHRNGIILLATELGLYFHEDEGENWKFVNDIPDVLCITGSDEIQLLGSSENGIWKSCDGLNWQPGARLPARSFTGLAINSRFFQKDWGFLFGSQEGLWRTDDASNSWTCLNEKIPLQNLEQVVVVPQRIKNDALLVAGDTGIWISSDAGESWNCLLNEAAVNATYSPDGRIIAVVLKESGIRYTLDEGKTWLQINGLWDQGGRVLAISITNNGYVYIAFVEGIGENVSFWQGKNGSIYEVFRTTAGNNPVCSIWLPPEPTPDRPWFSSINNKVWKFSSRRSGAKVESSILSELEKEESIVSLTGKQVGEKVILYACTGAGLYHSLDEAKSWLKIHDFEKSRLVNLQLIEDGTFIALLLGGEIIRLIPG